VPVARSGGQIEKRDSVSHVTSKDGTPIAYERSGSGPTLVLVGGGLDDGSENAPLVPELAMSFTVVNYSRRGRGGSGDTQPYSLGREIEDIDALIAASGGSAHVYGVSSGGALAIEAAATGSAIDRLAVYEVPYMIAEEVARGWQRYLDQLGPALAEGRRGDAIELFMEVAGSSEDDIEGAKRSPFWPGLEEVAHTLAYDAACLGDGRPPTARLRKITQPTLVATGGGDELFEQAADAIAASIPNAERLTIEGQGHVAAPVAVGEMLERFFLG
jgi:pimeloyl-ACP methyl ester carboxylesterase